MGQINSTVRKKDILTKDEIGEKVIEYVNAQKSGETEEADRLFSEIWMAVKKYVITLYARHYPTYYQKYYEEMLQEAVTAIFIKAPLYDVQKGAFLTFIKPFVLHVGGEFVNYLNGMTSHYGTAASKIKKCLSQFAAEDKQNFTPYDISEKTGIPLSTVNKCLELMTLNNHIHIDSSEIMKENLESALLVENSPEDHFLQQEKKAAIHNAISKLSPEIRKTILCKYGFEDGITKTDLQVAEKLNITKSAVRRAINTGCKELGYHLSKERLFESENIRREIDQQEICFVPSVTEEDLEAAKMFMNMNTVGF